MVGKLDYAPLNNKTIGGADSSEENNAARRAAFNPEREGSEGTEGAAGSLNAARRAAYLVAAG